MRTNLPITENRRHLDPKRPVVTKTNLKGVITYANPAFLDISGFSREELLGSPHNIVRHPDMPEEAFADLWRTLHRDQPWRGLVKNRCKNGDFYWVEAYVTPLYENGVKIGYMSVRNRPDEAEVEQADALYRSVKAKQAPFPATTYRSRTSLRVRITMLAILPLLLTGVGMVAGIPGWVSLIAGAVAAAAAGVWSWAGLSAPLASARSSLGALSEGNFRFSVETLGPKEFGDLLVALKSMQINLRAIIADVVSAAEYVRSRSGSVHREVGEMAGRSIEQQEGIAAVAAALEQLSVSVKEISEATARGAANAQSAMQQVDLSTEAMQSTVGVTRVLVDRVSDAEAVIEQLGQEIHSVTQVTQTIKEIADQTNLLALNAAIEAARAGESGRGFAVVADEVRKLAERTAQSTVEIATTIERIVERTGTALSAMQLATGKVDESMTLIQSSSEALDGIKAACHDVSASSQDIADMLRQQSAASTEVATSMERMSAITESNSQSMQTVERSMDTLEETSGELHLLVRHFEDSL